jgi:hypothetical protein
VHGGSTPPFSTKNKKLPGFWKFFVFCGEEEKYFHTFLGWELKDAVMFL